MNPIDVRDLPLPAAVFCPQDRTLALSDPLRSMLSTPKDMESVEAFTKTLSLSVSTVPQCVSLEINGRQFLATGSAFGASGRFLVTFQESEMIAPAVREMAFFQESEDLFHKIIGAVHDDFVIIDKKGMITHAFHNFEKYYGIPREHAIGKSIFEMEEQGIFNPSVALRVLKSGKVETMVQYTGADKYLMCTAIPIMDEENRISDIISYTTDITKYTKLKEEFSRLQETLELYSTELAQLRQPADPSPVMVSKDKRMQDLISTIERIAGFDTNVLFLGKSGVGKTMYAKLMHSRSQRQNGPFIHINCGAIPENLLESELFGYEKGAFTGAQNKGKPGLIELANNGTLFLDEIADLPFNMQVKLLKVLQEKALSRIGSTEEKKIDFRLIAATNKDLKAMVQDNEFREDLYYRINIITLEIPSLADRKSDIFPMILTLLERCNAKYEMKKNISNTAIDRLVEYAWPGNVRELENTMERLVLSTDRYLITEEDLPAKIRSNNIDADTLGSRSLKTILATVEKRLITEAYKKHGTTTGVARELDISQPSASLKIKKYLKTDN